MLESLYPNLAASLPEGKTLRWLDPWATITNLPFSSLTLGTRNVRSTADLRKNDIELSLKEFTTRGRSDIHRNLYEGGEFLLLLDSVLRSARV